MARAKVSARAESSRAAISRKWRRRSETLKAVIKKAKARSGSNLGLAGFFFARVLPTGGPTASRACENWRVPGAGADPNPDEPLVPVPVPGGVGCFRAEKLQEFLLVIFFCS